MHQLNPNLKKEKWTLDDNKKLFDLHDSLGNHWKDIARHYPGRSDNSIKNNFFSLIRKSLRNACKIIGNYQNSNFINKIKPKILSVFMKQQLKIVFTGKFSQRPEEIVKISDIIQRLSFGKYAEIYTAMDDVDKYKLKQCILYLMELNGSFEDRSDELTISDRKKKISKKKEGFSVHDPSNSS